MSIKEYLKQAFYLDKQIESKIEQIEVLNNLATKATIALSDMPKNPNRRTYKMENTIIKIIDLKEEVSADMDQLVDLKKEITETIKKVENKELQVLLEKRYLCFETWEQIALDMHYDIRHIYRLHNRALKEVEKILLACQ